MAVGTFTDGCDLCSREVGDAEAVDAEDVEEEEEGAERAMAAAAALLLEAGLAGKLEAASRCLEPRD
jgi:hypothetical protein